MMKNFLKKYFPYIFSFFIVCLVYYALPKSILKTLPFADATIFEYFGFAISKGSVMYVNVFDHKGPIIFLINYLGYLIDKELGIKFIYLLCLYIYIYITYKITTVFNKNNYIYIPTILITIITFLNVFELGYGLEGYMLPFITYALYVYLDYFVNNRYTYFKIFLVGISFSVVFFTKVNMVGVWIILSLGVFIYTLHFKKYKELANFILYFSSGAVTVATILIVYLYKNNALYEMFYDSIIINIKYVGDKILSTKFMIMWLYKMLNDFYLIIILLIASLVLYMSKKRYRFLSVILLLTVIFCSYMTIISNRNYKHYLIVLIPLFTPYIYIFINSIFKITNKKIGVVLVIILLALYIPRLENIKNSIAIREIDNTKNYLQVVQHIKDNTNESDKIYSHKMAGAIYLLTNRLSSTKYFFIPALNEEYIAYDFKKDFEKNLPKIIVINVKDKDNKIDKYIKEMIEKNYMLTKKEADIEVYNLIR